LPADPFFIIFNSHKYEAMYPLMEKWPYGMKCFKNRIPKPFQKAVRQIEIYPGKKMKSIYWIFHAF
jgi:hypothetical protein